MFNFEDFLRGKLEKLNWHPVPMRNVPGNKSGNNIYIRRWYEKMDRMSMLQYNPTGPDATKLVPNV
jgi:hypothetical protein